jgi:hypothetical protein
MESEYEYEMRTRAGRVASELSRPRLGTYRELQCETRDSEPTSDDDDEQYTPRAIASGRQAPARPQFLPDARHRRAPSPLPTCREHVRPRKECDKCFADLEEYYRFTRMERFRQARAQTEALADLYDSPQRPPPPHRFAPVLRANPQVPAS